MMQQLRFILFVLALVSLAGCGGQPTPTGTPTESPTPTKDTGPTLPPSWTPGTPPTLEPPNKVTLAPESTQPVIPTLAGGPTLPPSWTPAVIPSATRPPLVDSGASQSTRQAPTITPVVVLTSAFQLPTKPPQPGEPPTPAPSAVYGEACATFGRVAPTTSTIFPKEKAQISWGAVKGAEGYRVWILNAVNVYSFNQIVTETTITIPADIFIWPGVYGWEVMPLMNEDRMCGSLTGIILVKPGGK